MDENCSFTSRNFIQPFSIKNFFRSQPGQVIQLILLMPERRENSSNTLVFLLRASARRLTVT